MRTAVVLVMAAGALAMAFSPASAQSTKDRVEMLEQAVSDLQARAPGAAEMSMKVGRLEEEVRTLTGRIEELTYELDQANARIESLSAALAGEPLGAADGAYSGYPGAGASGPARLGAGYPNSDPIGDRIAEAAGDEAEVALPLDPDAAFDYASSFLLRSDYARARKAFELYVEAFPNHPRTADAQYRLGETCLAVGDNTCAADAFIKHVQKYPNNPRAAEAYLKLGTAFARLQKNAEACQVFKSMRGKFPGMDQAVRSRVDLEMSRINCR